MDHDSLNEALLEKLKLYSQKPNDCIEGIRTVAAKLHSRAASQDKNIKNKTLERIWAKKQGGLTLILYMLETVRDPLTACSLAGILRECVAAKVGRQRSPAISQLIHLNATQSLIKHLNQLQVKESVAVNDLLIQELIWILSQLAQKDAKFSLKTRLLGAVKTFHYFLKAYNSHAKSLFPILLIIKALSRNTTTAGALAKDGIVSTMEKVLCNIGFSPSAKLRLALNIMTYLSKNKNCCSKIIQSSILPLILRVFERWERYDGKMRLKICHYCLVTLQRICYLKNGRKAVRANSGLILLYKFCHNCPEERSYDAILTRVCGVINFCLERKTLPVDDIVGPGKFLLPAVSEVSIERCGSNSREHTPDFDEGDSDDELVDDPDEDGVVQIQGIDPDEAKMLPVAAIERDVEDLKQYHSFCPEFGAARKNQQSSHWNQVTKSVKNNYKDRSKVTMNDLFTNGRCKTFVAVEKGQQLTADVKIVPEDKFRSSDIHFVPSDNSFGSKYSGKKLSDVSNKESFVSRRSIENKSYGIQESGSKCTKNNMILLNSLKNLHAEHGLQHAYTIIASQVHSIIPFVKVAYPDLVGGDGIGRLEPLNTKDRKVCRQKLISSVDRSMHPGSNPIYNVVYDLDSYCLSQKSGHNKENRELFNDDEKRVGVKTVGNHHLQFESRFESGNLRKATQIGLREYELILNSDVNSDKHHNWFYFEVSNMDNAAPYVFNIVNFEKMNSQFNYGMKPILYSVQEALFGRPGWVRAGTDICYYRNSYQKTTGQQKCYFTTTFTILFQHNKDVCYIAYHFPYTYSQILCQIWKWYFANDYDSTYFKAEPLCDSLNKNQVPLLTISSAPSDQNPISERETIFLTARVHPGESNASWIMSGTLNFLLGQTPQAISLRNKYVFKVIPMLNIEGVINGCTRCGLSNEDLNRRWKNPHPILHPEIYHAKGLLEYCTKVIKKPPYLFCDFHGHSRKKNVFLYGCANSESWAEVDRQQIISPVEYLLIAHLMKHFCPAFSFPSCKFRIERSRESTARVAVWRDFGIKRSYTMESSYCGCDQGVYSGHHLDTKHLKEIGSQFCEVLSCLHDETTWRMELMIESQEAAASDDFLTSPSEVVSENKHRNSIHDMHRVYY